MTVPSSNQVPHVEMVESNGTLRASASAWHPRTSLHRASLWQPGKLEVESSTPKSRDSAEEAMVRALRQIVSTPRIKFMSFNGDPMNYVSIIHNSETFLEKDNPDSDTRLQLLIQIVLGRHGKR